MLQVLRITALGGLVALTAVGAQAAPHPAHRYRMTRQESSSFAHLRNTAAVADRRLTNLIRRSYGRATRRQRFWLSHGRRVVDLTQTALEHIRGAKDAKEIGEQLRNLAQLDYLISGIGYFAPSDDPKAPDGKPGIGDTLGNILDPLRTGMADALDRASPLNWKNGMPPSNHNEGRYSGTMKPQDISQADWRRRVASGGDEELDPALYNELQRKAQEVSPNPCAEEKGEGCRHGDSSLPTTNGGSASPVQSPFWVWHAPGKSQSPNKVRPPGPGDVTATGPGRVHHLRPGKFGPADEPVSKKAKIVHMDAQHAKQMRNAVRGIGCRDCIVPSRNPNANQPGAVVPKIPNLGGKHGGDAPGGH